MAVQGDYLWYFTGRNVTRLNMKTLMSKVFTPEDGLVSPFVDRIVAGPDGTIWFASDEGLSRFDGVSFTTFPRKLRPLWGFDIAPDGIVWVVDNTYKKLNRFDGVVWTEYSVGDSLAYDYVSSLAVGRNGDVWVATFDSDREAGLVSRYDGSIWQTYSPKNGFPGSHVTSITVGPDGVVWFGTNDGLYRYDGITCRHYTTADGLGCVLVKNITVAPDGIVWIGVEANIINVSRDNGATLDVISNEHKADCIAFDSNNVAYIGNGIDIYRYGEPRLPGREPPQLVNPSDMSVLPYSEETTFMWTSFPGAEAYEVQFWSYKPDYNRQGGTVVYEPFLTMTMNELYTESEPAWWRVRARIGDEYSQWSETLRFSTALPPVRLSSPADMALVEKNTVITFLWAESEFAYLYEVQFSDTPDFINPKQHQVTANNILHGTGEGYTDLEPAYWRVRIRRNDQYSDWSTVFRYYTERPELQNDFSRYNAENDIHALLYLDGYIWCGTSAGLIRWNPHDRTYKRFSMTDGLVHDTVTALTIDPEGLLWIGTKGGVSKFDGSSWMGWTTADGLAENYITSVEIGMDGCLYAGTWAYGLSRFDGSTWITYREGIYGSQVLRSNNIGCLDYDPNGVLWIGTRFGLTRFDGEKWQTYFASPSGLGDDEIHAVKTGDNGEVWAATRGSGVCCFDGKTWKSYTEETSGLLSNWVSAINIGRSGEIWFGVLNGISRFDGKGWKSYSSRTGVDIPRNVAALEIDPEGTVWAGTPSGLFRLISEVWEPLYTEIGPVILSGPTDMAYVERNKEMSFSWASSPGAVTYEIEIADNGDFLDSDRHLVKDASFSWTPDRAAVQNTPMYWRVRFERMDGITSGWSTPRRFYTQKEGTWRVYNTNNGLINNNVNCLAIGPDGSVWAGTEAGLSVFDGETWTSYTAEKNGLLSDYIQAITVDRDNVAWIGTQSGISRFDGCTWTTYTMLNGLPNNDIRTLASAGNGDVWAGTMGGGVSRFDGTKWNNFSLKNNNVNELVIAPNGDIWVATHGGGIQHFDGVRWSDHSEDTDLLGNFIYCVCAAPDGTVWASISKTEYYSDALGIFSYDGRKWTRHLTERAVELVYGPDEKIWAQLAYGKLMKYDGKTWTFDATVTWEATREMSGSPVFSPIVFSPDNSMWGAAWATHWEHGPFGAGIYVYDDYIMTPVTEKDSTAPSALLITGSYPNPFNPSTTIEFFLPDEGFANLVIYNIMGQKIRTLLSQPAQAGRHSILWDGTNDRGETVSSGVYLAKLKARSGITYHRMLLVR
ncbi:T9SS type A sorting domain-containing protein [bacterium]|nr:T9SS type A sorting domain-containing protein [bacterium]